MSGICRAIVDTAGGGPLIATQTTVFANSSAVIVNGDPVTPHGTNLHAVPVMVAGSNNVFVGGVAVCNSLDLATCLHPASGSSDVNVGN
jgi:uncharacterized Zn-binding protein involved in type VI secretion